MFDDALPPATRACLAKLGDSQLAAGFYLAGGTAVALHLGHRLSVDLDFFGPTPFAPQQMAERLAALGRFRLEQIAIDTLLGELEEVKIGFFRYGYPLLASLSDLADVAVAGLPDLVAMKLDALAQRGARRDFVDLFFLGQAGYPPKVALDLYQRKYAHLNVNRAHVIKALTYFVDAESDPMPQMLKPVRWEDIVQYFSRQAKSLLDELTDL